MTQLRKTSCSIALFLLVFWPFVAEAQGFYHWKAEAARREWWSFHPDELIVSIFGEEEEKTVESTEYRIEINVAARRLFLYQEDQIIRSYPVAVGTSRYRTPIGPRHLANITWNPWWYPPPYSDWAKDAKPTPPGPGNPLGRVKMALGGDIFLHATNKEYTVGTAASHGCMRMKNKDAVEFAWFFQKQFSDQTDEALQEKYEKNRWTSFVVPLSQKIPVDVVYTRVWVNADEVEVHPDIYGRGGDLNQEIVGELDEIGIPPWDVDVSKVEELKRLPGTFTVWIEDLLAPQEI